MKNVTERVMDNTDASSRGLPTHRRSNRDGAILHGLPHTNRSATPGADGQPTHLDRNDGIPDTNPDGDSTIIRMALSVKCAGCYASIDAHKFHDHILQGNCNVTSNGMNSVRQNNLVVGATPNDRMEQVANSTTTGVLLGATSTIPINAIEGMSGLIKQIGNRDDSV